MEQGVARHSLDNLVKSQQLISLSHGVYKRPETKLTWEGAVCSLQRMGRDLTVGGLSALSLQGQAHYLSLSEQKNVYLYGSDILPTWLNKLMPGIIFYYHNNTRLTGKNVTDTMSDFTIKIPWSDGGDRITMSSPERALFEVLLDVPAKISFEHADLLMQGLTTLSPRRLEKLLQKISSIKVKRLFFFLIDRQQHQWRNKLNPEDFDLGKGKRMLAKGGRLDKAYQITVPEALYGPQQ